MFVYVYRTSMSNCRQLTAKAVPIFLLWIHIHVNCKNNNFILFRLGMDLVPEPKIICAALRACRRLNDFALAVRFLECVKDKGGSYADKIYPYILQEIRPTLDELGISTPEELGFDKPELAYESVYHM